MTTVKGPGIFLAQFMGDAAPFNSLESICRWAKSIGFAGVQIPWSDLPGVMHLPGIAFRE